MAAALRPGGIYLLGFHLTPARRPICEREAWTARRGNLEINSLMWTISTDRRRRCERVGLRFDVTTPRRKFRLEDELLFRTYTAAQFRTLLNRVPELELIETYDFTYDVAIRFASRARPKMWFTCSANAREGEGAKGPAGKAALQGMPVRGLDRRREAQRLRWCCASCNSSWLT